MCLARRTSVDDDANATVEPWTRGLGLDRLRTLALELRRASFRRGVKARPPAAVARVAQSLSAAVCRELPPRRLGTDEQLQPHVRRRLRKHRDERRERLV